MGVAGSECALKGRGRKCDPRGALPVVGVVGEGVAGRAWPDAIELVAVQGKEWVWLQWVWLQWAWPVGLA